MPRTSHNTSEFNCLTRTIDTPTRPQERFVALFEIVRTGDVKIGSGNLMPVQLHKRHIIVLRNGEHKRHKWCFGAFHPLFVKLCHFGKLHKPPPIRGAGEECLVR